MHCACSAARCLLPAALASNMLACNMQFEPAAGAVQERERANRMRSLRALERAQYTNQAQAESQAHTHTHTLTRARTNERANEPNQRSDDALIVYNTCRLYNSWLACKRRCVTLLLPPSQPACLPASLLNCCDCRYCFCCCCCLIASIEPQRAPPSPFRIGCSRKHSLRARTHTHTGDRPIARLRESERAKQQQQQRNATLIAQTK